jgi:hypothetical protein
VQAVNGIDVLVFFLPFVSVTFTAMLQCLLQCYMIAPHCWFGSTIDSAISFLFFASRMSPHKKMKSIVRVKLSLISFIWAYVRLLSHVTLCFVQRS